MAKTNIAPWTRLRASGLVGLLGLSLLLGGMTPVWAQANFDGTWQVSRTGVGCTPTGAITVMIRGGKISGRYAGASGMHVVVGTVGKAGAFSFTGRSPTDVVRFSGRISGDRGTGAWTLQGKACSGSLTMSR